MAKQPDSKIPIHLSELLSPTPSGTAKLIAAWDDLSTETQILILSALEEYGYPAYLNEKIRIKAIQSRNAYIRYQAANKLFFSDRDSTEKLAIKNIIENDPDPLVRYCKMENTFLFGSEIDPQAFFELPHEARLAKIRCVVRGGETISQLISYAAENLLPNGRISEIELYEILADYIMKPEFKEEYEKEPGYDGYNEYTKGKDIESLWSVVLKIPESVSHILLENVPYKSGLGQVSSNVLSSLSKQQLQTLLDRTDVALVDIRKKIFFEASTARDTLKDAAISSHFDLTHAEFAQILAKPESEKIRILKDLAMMAGDLSLCLFDALHDILWNSEEGLFDTDYAEFAKTAFKRKVTKLEGSQRQRQVFDLRLYRLARSTVPWQGGSCSPLPDNLSFLESSIVPNKTWSTFMAFSEAWGPEWMPKFKGLEKDLPHIAELDKAYQGEDTSDIYHEEDESSRELNRIEEKLAKIFSVLTSEGQDKEQKISEWMGQLVAESIASRKHAMETVDMLRSEIKALHDAQRRHHFFWYIFMALVFIVFMSGFFFRLM